MREGCHFLSGARTLPKSEKSTPPETVKFLLTFCCPKAIFFGLVGGGHARPPEMRQFHVFTLLRPKPSKRPQTSEKKAHRQRPRRRKLREGCHICTPNRESAGGLSFSHWRPDPPKIRKIHPAGNRQIPVNFLLSKSDFFWPRGGGSRQAPGNATVPRFDASQPKT